MKKSWHLDRRTFLRGAGVGVSLPMLDAMLPVARAARRSASESPTRMLCVGLHLGLHGPAFYPKQAGRNYETTTLLAPIDAFRDDFTVFSGLDHPGVGKGHPATVNFLTGAANPKKRKLASLDQVAAQAVRSETRFASLQLEARNAGSQKGRYLSWAKGGVPLPQENDPRALFDKLFKRPADGKQAKESLSDARSILDHVLEDAHDLQSRLGTADREKLDEYLSAVREVEREIQQAEKWAGQPGAKAASDVEIPGGRLSTVQGLRVMYRLIALAFQSDLTRVATLRIPGEQHPLSHHGQKANKVKSLVKLQQGYMTELAGLLKHLKSTTDGDGTLLDHTMVLYGSGMGNAAAHSTRNLPILLAGGGFRHGGHQKFGGKRKPPLANLYVTMLQRMGLEVGKFSSSRGTFGDI